MFRPFSPPQTIAACALFLSAKVEEELRKLEYVIRACHESSTPSEPPLTPEVCISFKCHSSHSYRLT